MFNSNILNRHLKGDTCWNNTAKIIDRKAKPKQNQNIWQPEHWALDQIKAKQNQQNRKLLYTYPLVQSISKLHRPLAGLKIYTIRLIHLLANIVMKQMTKLEENMGGKRP